MKVFNFNCEGNSLWFEDCEKKREKVSTLGCFILFFTSNWKGNSQSLADSAKKIKIKKQTKKTKKQIKTKK